jgi:hypothetical protein
MTTLSKDKIFALAREAGFHSAVFDIERSKPLANFARLCRADLVVEIEQLRRGYGRDAVYVVFNNEEWVGEFMQALFSTEAKAQAYIDKRMSEANGEWLALSIEKRSIDGASK